MHALVAVLTLAAAAMLAGHEPPHGRHLAANLSVPRRWTALAAALDVPARPTGGTTAPTAEPPLPPEDAATVAALRQINREFGALPPEHTARRRAAAGAVLRGDAVTR